MPRVREILTQHAPFSDMEEWQIPKAILQGYTMPLPLTTPPILQALVARCCHVEPELRPSFSEVLSELSLVDTSALESLLIPDPEWQPPSRLSSRLRR